MYSLGERLAKGRLRTMPLNRGQTNEWHMAAPFVADQKSRFLFVTGCPRIWIDCKRTIGDGSSSFAAHGQASMSARREQHRHEERSGPQDTARCLFHALGDTRGNGFEIGFGQGPLCRLDRHADRQRLLASAEAGPGENVEHAHIRDESRIGGPRGLDHTGGGNILVHHEGEIALDGLEG
jgi:hypothetical protein